MNKIEFFRNVEGEDGKPEARIETGMPMVLFSEDKSMKLMLAYFHFSKNIWACTEIYTGLCLTSGRTKAELFEHIAQAAGQVFEIDWITALSKYYDKAHQIVAEAYKKLDEARPSGLFGRYSLSQGLIEYITAPTFKEAISNGKKE